MLFFGVLKRIIFLVDTGSQYLLPRMTEISFVIMSRATYVEGIQRMHNICLNNEKTDLKVQLPTRIYCQQFNPELSDEEWRAYEQNRNSMTGHYFLNE